jgi:16S rRNA (uracil1498-N3)-methyltransferase
MSGRIRLFVDQPLALGQAVSLSAEQAHYLTSVMRQGVGAGVALFNGRDGEWQAELAEAGKRRAIAVCGQQTAPQRMPPDLWLLFAPVKRDRTNFIVEKAVELGVARILPVATRHMNSERLRRDKQQAHAVEAAEQCGATFVPEVAEMQPLDRVLAEWDSRRTLYWCDEARAGQGPAFPASGAAAILIGPEGGFSAEESRRLGALAFMAPLALGPRILRAETAAVAAITLWQAAQGDWR